MVATIILNLFGQIIGSAAGLTQTFLSYNALNQAPVFICGCFAYFAFLRPGRVVPPRILAAVIAIAAALTAVWWGGKLPGGHVFKPIGAGIMFAAFAIALAQHKCVSRSYIARVGTRSYSIFIVHAFVLEAAGAMLSKPMAWLLSPAQFAMLLAVITFASTDFVAMLSYRLIEQPFIKLGRRVLSDGRQASNALTVVPFA